MLTVLDEFTREGLCIQVDGKIGDPIVLTAKQRRADPLLIQRGMPTYLRSDTDLSREA